MCIPLIPLRSQVGSTELRADQHGDDSFQYLIKNAESHDHRHRQKVSPLLLHLRASQQDLIKRLSDQQAETEMNDAVVVVAFEIEQGLHPETSRGFRIGIVCTDQVQTEKQGK